MYCRNRESTAVKKKVPYIKLHTFNTEFLMSDQLNMVGTFMISHQAVNVVSSMQGIEPSSNT